MEFLTKEELSTCLMDYANLCELAFKNSDISYYDLFSYYMGESNRLNEWSYNNYLSMINVVSAYCFMKEFSFIVDFLLNRDDFISDVDLKELNNIFSKDAKKYNLANKNLVILMRNAFCHNDSDDFNKFSISKDGKFVKFSFKDIRKDKEKSKGGEEKPLSFVLSCDSLVKISNILSANKQNCLFCTYDIPSGFKINPNTLFEDLDSIKFVHYYFTKKLNDNDIKKMVDASYFDRNVYHSLEEMKELSKGLHVTADDLKGSYKKVYSLTSEQKNKLWFDIIFDINQNLYIDLIDSQPEAMMHHYLNKVIPVPIFKNKLYNSLLNNNILLFNKEASVDINFEFSELIVNNIVPVNFSEIDMENYVFISNSLNSYTEKIDFMDYLSKEELICFLPKINFIDFVLSSLCKDEYIEVDGIKYKKERLRNSLVHGRWYFSYEKNILLFDTVAKNTEDYKLTEVGNINIEDLWTWANDYIKEEEVINTKTNIFRNIFKLIKR